MIMISRGGEGRGGEGREGGAKAKACYRGKFKKTLFYDDCTVPGMM